MSTTRKQIMILATIFIVTRILCFLLVAPGWSDIPIYSQYSDNIFGGQIPYKDFQIEYPPLAILVLIIPGLLAKLMGNYILSYRLFMMLFDFGNLWLINKIASCTGKSDKTSAFKPLLFYLILSGLTFQLLYDRLDIVVAFLILWSVYLAISKKSWLGAYSVVWAAVLLKLFPLILFPWFWIVQSGNSSKKKKAFIDFGLASLFFILAVVFSGILFGDWWDSIIAYHGGRGIQIESIYGNIASIAALFGAPYSINHNFGSFNIENSFTGFLATFSPFISVAALIFGYYLVYQIKYASKEKGNLPDFYIIGILELFLLFVVFNKVLSPQYLLWIFPFAALTINNSKYNLILNIFWLIVATVTAVLYPHFYPDMIMQKIGGVFLLTIRNLILLAIVVLLSINIQKTRLMQIK